MVIIFADTTSSIPTEEAKKLGIEFFPQIIVFGNESYRDDYEITSEQFLTKLKSARTLPKTAAPPPVLYTPVYEKYLKMNADIIVLTPSQKVSGTFRSAEVAAQEFNSDKIHIIDTKNIGAGLATIVKKANQWCQADLPVQEIITNINQLIAREKNIYVVDTLEYLHKGGRIGGAQMLVGSLLQVKPILSFIEGQVEPVESQRTKKKALSRLKEMVLENCPKSNEAMFSVQHGDAFAEAQKLAEEIKEILGIDQVNIYDLPPAFMVHTGPGVLGVSYFTEA